MNKIPLNFHFILTVGLLLITLSAFSATYANSEIIVDNDDPNTERVGTWQTSYGVNPYGDRSEYVVTSFNAKTSFL